MSLDTADITLAGMQAAAPPPMTLKPGMSKDKVMAAAKDFEAVFATQMLTHMFEGIKVDSAFGGGHGEEMFRTVLLDEYGKEMGRNDTFGIARQVADTLLKAQEGH